jgi:hypothetical protein
MAVYEVKAEEARHIVHALRDAGIQASLAQRATISMVRIPVDDPRAEDIIRQYDAMAEKVG